MLILLHFYIGCDCYLHFNAHLRPKLTDPFNNRPEDVPNKAIRAGVGALPVVGSPLLEFLAFVIGDPAQERRDDFMKETVDRVMSLESKFKALRPDALRENEQFQATFIQSVRIATTTASAAKKKLLQNAILNSAVISVSENYPTDLYAKPQSHHPSARSALEFCR